MPWQAFLYDDNHAGKAAFLAALAGYTNAKQDFTDAQVLRDASHDSTLKIVFANVTEAEIDADADLADARGTNFPTELCRERWTSLADFRVRGFHMLGESVRSSIGVSGATCWYVRQEKYPTRTAYGEDTGKTPWDAADGWDDLASKLVSSTHARGDLVYGLDCNWAFRDGEAFDSINSSPSFPAGSGDTITWRMDHPLMPGMNYMGFVDRTSGSNTWTRPDAANHPRVWKATLDNLSGAGRGHMLLPIDPTLSTSDIYTNHLFGEGASQADVEANAFTAWVDTGSNEMWVHMPDDTDPSHRIGRPGFGWSPKIFTDPATQDVDLINCQMIGRGIDASGFGSNLFPKARILGGRYMMGCSFKPDGAIIAGTVIGRSTDGTIGWDTSDLPDPDTDEFIQMVVNEHGSDATVWAQFDYFLHIDTAREGIYNYHSGAKGRPDGINVSGVFQDNIGQAHPSIAAKHGNTITYADADSHAIGNQDCDDCVYEFFYSRNAGSHVNLYAITTATIANDMKNNTIRDFVIVGNNDNYGTSAGHNGIAMNGDGQVYARTGNPAGQNGDYSGNVIQRGVIADLVPDPAAAAFGSPPLIVDGHGIVQMLPDNVVIDNVSYVRLRGGRTGQLNADMAKGEGGGSDVTNPARGALVDPQTTETNCRYVEIEDRNLHMRTTKWELAAVAISSISSATPAVVTTSSAHGFPDIAQADVYIEPEVYFDTNVPELAGNIYKATWIDSTSFSIQTLAGADVDGSALTAFTAGSVGRAHLGFNDMHDNEIVLKSGKTASSDFYRVGGADYNLSEYQGHSRTDEPGASSENYETNTTIAA